MNQFMDAEMIDLHCHILHALDDGPNTVNESIQMAQALVRSGYRVVAATPHMVPGTAWMPRVDRITTQIMHLNQAMQVANLKLEIVSGMEIALDPQIPDLLDEGYLLPLGNSSCLLIEPSFQQLPTGWQQIIFAILSKGYSILLAHPERCPQLAANPELIEHLIDTGVYLQVNWGSFFGQYGRQAKRSAMLLARNGWIHCLATDGHHPEHVNQDTLQAIGGKLRQMIGLANLQQITVDNPLNLLRSEQPRLMTVASMVAGKGRRRWWQWW